MQSRTNNYILIRPLNYNMDLIWGFPGNLGGPI